MGRGQRDTAFAALAVRPRAAGQPRPQPTNQELNKDAVLLELAAFLVGAEKWPSRQEFIDAGHAHLYNQAERTGGAERWAPEFGLSYVPEPRDPDQEKLRAELAEFLADFDHWPTAAEFGAARRETLREKALKHGGAQRWAAEFGLPTLDERREALMAHRRLQAATRGPVRRPGRHWTTELVRSELAVFLNGADHFPSENEFVAAGESGLYRTVREHGGSEHWAVEFNLPRISDLKRRRVEALQAARAADVTNRQDKKERRVRELEEFCAGREHFPSRTEWAAAGREDLMEFVHRNGGVHEWSKRVGLPLRPAQDRRPYDIDRAIADGRQMLNEHGRIPGCEVLRQAGLNKLYLFIRREFNGDRAAFAERCR